MCVRRFAADTRRVRSPVAAALLLLATCLAACGSSVSAAPAALKHPREVRDARSLVPRPAAAGSYEAGSPRLTNIWVHPKRGRDSASGARRNTALRTVSAAWRRIPEGEELQGTGYRIMLAPGRYRAADVPVYWEKRYGTREAPVIIAAADGPGTVRLPALNLFDVRYLYLEGVTVSARGGDVVHCERCDHFLIRRSRLAGRDETAETLKVNQSQHVYVERSDIFGAGDNAIDFVAVQHGHLLANRISHAGDWCAYAKGGSGDIRVAGNEIYACGTGGFSAGQGTGLQFMIPPWIQYEAYDVEVFNNFVHDTEGAGLGVNGGSGVLLAHNTLYRVGRRSHTIEVVFGGRSCDGRPGDHGRERCRSYIEAGGWGTTEVDDGNNYVRIPNRDVLVLNNLVYNPPGHPRAGQLFTVFGSYDSAAQRASSGPSPAQADDGLQIRGNFILNGRGRTPLGIGGGGSGCPPSHPTCNPLQLRAENVLNRGRRGLANPRRGDFRPSTLAARTPTFALPGALGASPRPPGAF